MSLSVSHLTCPRHVAADRFQHLPHRRHRPSLLCCARYAAVSTGAAFTVGCGRAGELRDGVLLPTPNLSNKLNPNNVHYDRGAAAQYKTMSKADKETLWALDRSSSQSAVPHLQHVVPPPPNPWLGPAADMTPHAASLGTPGDLAGLLSHASSATLPSLGSAPVTHQDQRRWQERSLSHQSALLQRLATVGAGLL